jgi:hypothetical protein
MSRVDTDLGDVAYLQERWGWRELGLKEDWWAIWLGLAIIAAFVLLYLLSVGIFALGQWADAVYYNLEPPSSRSWSGW